MSKNKEANSDVQGASIQNELPERILINENLMYFDGLKKEATDLIEKANKLAEKYEQLEIGLFTQDVFNELVLIGYSSAREQYSKMILAETKNFALRNLMQNDVDRVFKELQAFVDDVKKLKVYGNTFSFYNLAGQPGHLHFHTFKDGRFILTDQSIEKIKDHHCRTYINTQEQLDAVENLKNLLSCFNKLNQDIKKFNPAIQRLFLDHFTNVGRYAIIEDGVATLYTENIVEVIGN
jgi:hypothetical protein